MELATKINQCFESVFGRTSLQDRLEDILTQTVSLIRYRDIPHLKEECGDLLTSVIQLANECGWDHNQIIEETLKKIDARKLQYQSLGRKRQIALHPWKN
jgi:NTP pyrophosphatase (non-canonical NTP hydrolase)